MKEICSQCHTPPIVDRVYAQAEAGGASTNEKVRAAQEIVSGLRKDGVLTGPPFSQPIDFLYFDLVALRRPHQQARGLHGRSRFRAVARQLSRCLQKTVELKAMADRAEERAWQIQVSAWWMKPRFGSSCSRSVNIGFLTFDIYLAHSVNQFRAGGVHPALFFR